MTETGRTAGSETFCFERRHPRNASGFSKTRNGHRAIGFAVGVLWLAGGWAAVFGDDAPMEPPAGFPVTLGLTVYLDSDTLEKDGAEIRRMFDRSGNAADAYLGNRVNGSGPAFLFEATPSRRHAVRFDGVGDYLEIEANPALFDGRAKTTLVVFRAHQLGLRRLVNSAYSTMDSGNPDALPVYLVHNLFASGIGDGTLRVQNRGASDASIAFSTADATLQAGCYYLGVNRWHDSGESTATLRNSENERFVAEATGADARPEGHFFTRIGAGAAFRDPEPEQFFDGEIAAVVVYNRELSGPELLLVEDFLYERYLEPFDPMRAYTDWMEEFDVPENLRSPSADASSDGISNLEKYAFGLDPTKAGRKGLPEGRLEGVGDRRHFEILLHTNPKAVGVNYLVQSSRDLVTWNAFPANLLIVERTPYSYRARFENGAEGASAGFARVKVSMDEPGRPFLSAAPDLFDEEDPETLGLEKLPVEIAPVYTATEDNWTFSHTPNLVVFKNELHLMWSNGEKDEDVAGQRILYSRSSDGIEWSEPEVLATPEIFEPGDPEGALMSSGWHIAGEALVAFMTWAPGSSFGDFERARLWSLRSTDGEAWEDPVEVTPGTYLEGPQRVAAGRWVLLGQGRHHQPIAFVTDSPDGQSGWTEAPIGGKVGPARWPEPSLFFRPDGSLVATLRVQTSERRLWAMESRDGGNSWSAPEPTGFPDTPARVSAGNLPDGTVYLVGNPGLGKPALNRDVLTVALSDDGRVFDRAFALLTDPPPLKFEGRAKFSGWQYPNVIVWDDTFYVAYSVGKEDIQVLRIPVDYLVEN